MSEAPTMPKSSKLITALALIAMMSGLLVAVTFQVTAPRIALNKQKALEKAIFAVLPEATSAGNFLLQDGVLTSLTAEEFSQANVFAGYNDAGELVGIAMEASARGYSDVVRILYAYEPKNQCILGFTVLQSTETPGIGDKIETDADFLKNFDCLDASLNADLSSLANDIITVKNGKKVNAWEIDGISGATITSKAIGNALNQSANAMLPDLAKNQALLEKKGDS
ncbi:RnfABCDGE type electron transport complex subunit G [Pelagicoccus mobilis]|uniref:Ion-translocating oxidoreductase complex subunit G n=1 Tax=Pelagicoccus mobilis TaxID=415221 RepID=A0A934VR42_9BACT|nr:RnfABCDGE type electron transport complex subunit G [Pelagicoccus mobilis]MBK1877550.1 RnfABCDGE type electron transport complex subunit G [Pelagicoccus mobilis]